jgi:uncharacterized iron-regulated membrane protein
MSLRKKLYGWHSWAGFQLAILSFVVLLSGTLAVVSDEIDWLLDGERHIRAFDGEPDWNAMYRNAQAVAPEGKLVAMNLGELPVMAAEARLSFGERKLLRVFLDPRDGRVLGTGSWINVQRILRDFHRYLFIFTKGLGLPIVTIVAVVLGVQLVTGLATTRKWMRGLITLPRRKNSRVFIGDLHRFAALWTTWFTLLIVVTSAWYFTEWGLHRVGVSVSAPLMATSKALADYPSPVGSLQRHIDATKAVFPEMTAHNISLPTARRNQVIITGPSTDWLLRDRASRVTLDPATAAVLAVQRPADLDTLEYLADLVDPVHFGSFGGLTTKILWFICGLLLTGLSASGVWLTWRRTRQTLGRWHLLTSVPIVAAVGLAITYASAYSM